MIIRGAISIFQLWWWRWWWRKVCWTWYWYWSNGWARATAFGCLMTIRMRMIVWPGRWRWWTWLSIVTITRFSQTIAIDTPRSVASGSEDICTIIMWFTRQRRPHTWMRSILVTFIAEIGRFCWWRWRRLIYFLIMPIIWSMAVCARRLRTWRRINIADAAIRCWTWSTRYIISIITIRYGCATIQRIHSYIFRNCSNFRMRWLMWCWW